MDIQNFMSKVAMFNKSAGVLGTMLTSGKVIGGAAALGTAGFVGYHLQRGADVMKQASVDALVKRAADLTGKVTQDFAGKKAPYIDLKAGKNGVFIANKGISLGSKAGLAGAALLGAGALAYNAQNNDEKTASAPAEIVMRDYIGKNVPYVDIKGKKGINATTAATLLAAGAIGYGISTKANDKLKGTAPEKVAGLLNQAASFIAKNKAVSGAIGGAALGSATASNGNGVSGAVTGAIGGAAAGKLFGGQVANGMGKMTNFAPKAAPTQNMIAPVSN